MLLTCKCLNVSISIAGAEIGAANYDDLAITDVERQDPFFSSIEIGQVELGEINKEQATLVYIKHTGDWLVHECLNCRTLTHAIHKERRGNCVVVNRALLSDQQQIEALKNCDAFSHVFKVVIDRDAADVGSPEPTPIPKFTALHPIGPLQAGLMALQQKLQEAMRNQTSAVEELVRQFSEQQYAELEAFRKVAHEDQVALARVLQACSALQQQEEALTSSKPPQQPPRHPKSSVKLDSVMLPLPYITPAAAAALAKVGGNAPLKPRKSFSSSAGAGDARPNRFGVTSSPGSRSSGFGAQSSLDAEGMFDLDGMDEPTQEPLHSEDETDDTDESGSHDEGIHIPRQRISNVAANNLARSLPVTVPIFQQSQPGGPNNYDGEEQARDFPQNPQDIAASIKALAKSVHGEHNVFGDLPRPRFSTQL